MCRTVRVVLSSFVGLSVFASLASSDPAPKPQSPPVGEPVLLPNLKYMGNASCSGDDCHSGTAKMQSGQLIGDELDVWFDSDPHAGAFRMLGDEASKTIASKLGIDDPKASNRCLTCHATNVPEPQRGESFAFANENVSCENCHGPAEKWLEPHAEAGWTSAKRAELKAAGLLSTHGLRDTSHLPTRAALCVSCHLKIDRELVETGGHPPLKFELNWFNHYDWHGAEGSHRIHWSSDVKVIDAMQWAAGQPAAAAAARRQVEAWRGVSGGGDTKQIETLASMYEAGARIASTHFGTEPTPGSFSAAKCAAAAADVAAQLGPLATTKIHREIAFWSVYALCAGAAGARDRDIMAAGGVPDAFWDGYEAALDAIDDGPADAFTGGLKQMAAAVAEGS